MANSRIYIQESVADSFIDAFKKKFAAVTAGDPLLTTTNHGPQADEIQFNNVQTYIEAGKKSGTMILGGGDPVAKTGFFINPAIFTNTAEDAKIMKEEIFGPVVNINVFKTEEEAVRKANDTEFGLYAAVYTKNFDRALRMARALEAGTVGVNCTSPSGARDMPFGGYKASGIGREGWSLGMDNYLETKSVLMRVESL
jgi:aldehyde dehydrogenase (NAD+)